jgi:hypothetical protein
MRKMKKERNLGVVRDIAFVAAKGHARSSFLERYSLVRSVEKLKKVKCCEEYCFDKFDVCIWKAYIFNTMSN